MTAPSDAEWWLFLRIQKTIQVRRMPYVVQVYLCAHTFVCLRCIYALNTAGPKGLDGSGTLRLIAEL